MTKHKTRLAPTPKASLGFVNVIASLCVWMAIYAVCFISVVVGVLAVGDCLKVVRVGTHSVPAFMVNFKPFWNWAYKENVGESVSRVFFTAFPITVSVYTSNPVPTPCFGVKLDSSSKLVKERYFHIRKEITPALKVKSADEGRNQNEGYKTRLSSFLGYFKAIERFA